MVNQIAQSAWPVDGTPLFKEVQSPYFLPVTEEILAEIARRIVEKLDPEKIVLFGSYAYGEPNQDSDVDLFIIQETTLRHAERTVEVSELILPRPFPIDIIVKTPAEVDDALRRKDFFISEIVDSGRILYERCKQSK
jgi:predicted nucleotidyltransferase